MTLVPGICRIVYCSGLLGCHTLDILVGCANEVTIHGDAGDEALQGTCNLFGSLTVVLSLSRRADIAQEATNEVCIRG
jgi:hypothetical protein